MEKSELILSKLASSLGRRDEVPNIELAQEIVQANDEEAVQILVDNLGAKKDVKRDCIKTLYEIGNLKPEYLSPYLEIFMSLLESKDNRMQWGAMTAIETIARVSPEKVYPNLPKIVEASEKGSVITRDHAVKILAHLGKLNKYREVVFQILHEILLTAPVNQFPTYAEQAAEVVDRENAERLYQTIEQRLEEMNTAAKKKRLISVLKKLK